MLLLCFSAPGVRLACVTTAVVNSQSDSTDPPLVHQPVCLNMTHWLWQGEERKRTYPVAINSFVVFLQCASEKAPAGEHCSATVCWHCGRWQQQPTSHTKPACNSKPASRSRSPWSSAHTHTKHFCFCVLQNFPKSTWRRRSIYMCLICEADTWGQKTVLMEPPLSGYLPPPFLSITPIIWNCLKRKFHLFFAKPYGWGTPFHNSRAQGNNHCLHHHHQSTEKGETLQENNTILNSDHNMHFWTFSDQSHSLGHIKKN